MSKFAGKRSAAAALAVLLALAAASAAVRVLRGTGAGAIAEGGTPWVRYVMVGLGGFRGVISEVLWLRAARLQEQGRYFELVTLSEWINALDPRAADAWVFNAWNLSYNISAMFPDGRSKLRWVCAGVSLLRDKAIPASPGEPSLYRELGWLYQNKIGANDDPANVAYKLELAKEMEAIFPERYGKDARGAAARPVEGAHGGALVTALDESTVREIEARFGRLDWRLPQPHAIYWAWQGFAIAPRGFERDSLRRMIQQNLVVLIGAGKFIGDADAAVWKTEPDFALVKPTIGFFEEHCLENAGERKVFGIFLDAVIQRLKAAGETALAAYAAEKRKALAHILNDGAASGDAPSF